MTDQNKFNKGTQQNPQAGNIGGKGQQQPNRQQQTPNLKGGKPQGQQGWQQGGQTGGRDTGGRDTNR